MSICMTIGKCDILNSNLFFNILYLILHSFRCRRRFRSVTFSISLSNQVTCDNYKLNLESPTFVGHNDCFDPCLKICVLFSFCRGYNFTGQFLVVFVPSGGIGATLNHVNHHQKLQLTLRFPFFSWYSAYNVHYY